MRRALILLVLIAVSGGVAWLLMHWDGAVASSADPWRAVPAEAAVIIEAPDALASWDRFSHTSLQWRSWEKERGAQRFTSVIARLSARIEDDPDLRAALGDGAVLVALLRSGQEVADALFVGASHAASQAKLAALFAIDASHRARFDEGRPVPCTTDSAMIGLHACSRDGLWMISSSASALDEALLQLERGAPILDDAPFARAKASIDASAEASVLIHTGRASAMLSAIWAPERIERLAIPQGWLAVEFDSKPDAVSLSGLFFPDGETPFTKSVAEQGSGAWSIGRMLPAGIASFEVRHVGDIHAAMDARAALDERSRSTEIIADWMEGSVGVARGANDSALCFLAEASDTDRAIGELLSPCAQVPCDTMSHRGIRLTRAAGASSYELLMGRYARLPQQPWWALVGRHVVMSDDPAMVASCIDAWTDGGSLAEQPGAKDAFKRLSDDAGLTWWLDPDRGAELIGEGLLPGRIEAFREWLPLLRRLNAISAQASPAPDGLLHVMITGQQHHVDGETATVPAQNGALWQCAVDAPVDRTPYLIRNHTNGTLEALVQDQAHRIHLISATGKSLWSRPLDGPILGGVHQVDRFKNGKLQLLLGTATTMHLIDRNGKDVGVPHKLPVEAAAPLAVFDYEGQREYRVLVPLTDGRVLNLDLDFATVQGWTTPRLDARPADAVRHVRVGGKDHLLTVDADGVVRIFDRKGNPREKVNARLDRVKRVMAIEPGQALASTRVTWMDQDLAIKAVFLDGAAAELPQGEPLDLDGDGVPEWLKVDGADASGATIALVAGDRLAFGRIDPSGDPWLFAPSDLKPPATGMVRWAVGDLNLDGSLELVGADGTSTISAYRFTTP